MSSPRSRSRFLFVAESPSASRRFDAGRTAPVGSKPKMKRAVVHIVGAGVADLAAARALAASKRCDVVVHEAENIQYRYRVPSPRHRRNAAVPRPEASRLKRPPEPPERLLRRLGHSGARGVAPGGGKRRGAVATSDRRSSTKTFSAELRACCAVFWAGPNTIPVASLCCRTKTVIALRFVYLQAVGAPRAKRSSALRNAR